MGRKKSLPPETITCRVKEFRLKKGWSQEELAEKIGIKRQAVYDIESGRYLPNTGIALRLARVFGCPVETLFVEDEAPEYQPVDVIGGPAEPQARLALGRIRDRIIGFPLKGPESFPFGLRAADGLMAGDGKSAQLMTSAADLNNTVIVMGCDPAFGILGPYMTRMASEVRVHCCFASSHSALNSLARGEAHVAGTHLHNSGPAESNLEAVRQRLRLPSRVFGYSVMEEGLMVARGNPLGIRTVSDLANPRVRFANREPGAALRVLLDDQLKSAGLAPDAICGYRNEVFSHREGAYRIACNVADAALGLRVVAEVFDLGFVPITAVRCDLVIPEDLFDHPAIQILLDTLQSRHLHQEISTLPGYDSSVTGQLIAELPSEDSGQAPGRAEQFGKQMENL